jgi:cell division protein FtsW
MEKRGSYISLKGDKAIWTIIFFLSLISIAAVYSSSSSLAFMQKKSTTDFLMIQMRYVIFSLTALYICYKIPLGWYRILSKFIFGISIILLLLTLIAGAEYNQAGRWIKIFDITFQPAEFAKVTTLLYLAKVMEDKKFDTFKEYAVHIMTPVAMVLLLILYGSVSAALLLGGVIFIMLVLGGIKWSHIFKTGLIALSAITFVVLLNLSFGLFPRIETAISRVKNFTTEQEINEELSPVEKQRILDKTFQADMARIAVASVGVLGKGPGNSTQRTLLPHPYSDFIYAIIIEEWGSIGGIILLMLYVWMFSRSIMITKKCKTTFSSMVVMGLALLITSQAMLHICVNVGLLPVTGHTLPLVSLGGTSLLIVGGSFGIILSVSRTIESGQVTIAEEQQIENTEEQNTYNTEEQNTANTEEQQKEGRE